jgi:phosphatidylserine/phosphatidylglycerophosphate/cardiolipin synthase-like enzyme
MRNVKLLGSLFAAVALMLGALQARADVQLPYVVQGKTQFFPDDNIAWFARYHILKNAQKSILTSYFILSDDVFGESFLALLCEKAKAGLEVKLMIDNRGSFGMAHGMLDRALLREVIKCGGEVRVFNPFLDHGISSDLVASDHQKLLLVDDHWFMTGGRNISQEYFLDENDLPATYHDEDVLVDSADLGARARELFMVEYDSPRGVPVESEGLFGNILNHLPRLQQSLAAMEDRLFHINNELKPSTVDSHPELARWDWIREFQVFEPFQGPPAGTNYFTDVDDGKLDTATLNTPNPITLLANTSAATSKQHELSDAVRALIDDAQQEILIENPYVVLQPATEAALIAAAKRGVKIILVTNGPKSTDSPLTQAQFIENWKKMITEMPGSVVFMATGIRQVHAKLFVFDRAIPEKARALVGSFNLDALSDHINSEDALLVQSAPFAQNVAYSILEEIEMDAAQLTPDRGPEKVPGMASAVSGLKGIYLILSKILKPMI